ncbi:MAG: M48 family metallopeptidase [Rubrivivax sp.]|nr:M48 family metallopeptidase [Rubrivivax sp.]
MNDAIAALYFDGQSARPLRMRVTLSDGQLAAAPEPLIEPMVEPVIEPVIDAQPTATTAPRDDPPPLRWPLAQVQWPERTRHGRRVVHLADGGQFEFPDAAAFDAWRAAHGVGESWVVRAQQHWRATLTALVVLVAVLAAGYRWGVPWAADALVAVVPLQVDHAVGEAAFDNLRQRWLGPSALPATRQQALREQCAEALRAAVPAAGQRPWTLHFARGGKVLGANAFALPGGSIVITDEMVALLEGHDDTLVGVFGHEYGHVHLRHGMRALARFTLVSTATGVALGDFSTVLAGLPALLAHLGYSRDAEREADETAARMLVASGRRPEVMAVLFERLSKRSGGQQDEGAGGLPIALASHPHDEERVRFFREYAQQRR